MMNWVINNRANFIELKQINLNEVDNNSLDGIFNRTAVSLFFVYVYAKTDCEQFVNYSGQCHPTQATIRFLRFQWVGIRFFHTTIDSVEQRSRKIMTSKNGNIGAKDCPFS